MGDFDRIFKENIESLFTPLLEKLLNISISKTQEIKDKLQKTIEREPDFLKLVTTENGMEFILQLEFQTRDDPKMAFRMAEYKALLQRKYELPVRQFVIYLGSHPSQMVTELPEAFHISSFELKNLHDIQLEQTIHSSIPEEIILSILTNYRKEDAEQVIIQIIKNLKRSLGKDPVIERYIKQLVVLARLRNLESVTKKQLEVMPITYDITTDGLYLEGIEKGITENTIKLIKNMLNESSLSTEQIARIADVSVAYVEDIQRKEI